jgi:hypothetical protein
MLNSRKEYSKQENACTKQGRKEIRESLEGRKKEIVALLDVATSPFHAYHARHKHSFAQSIPLNRSTNEQHVKA